MFCLYPGDKHFSHTVEGGQTFLTQEGRTNIFDPQMGGQTFYVEDVGGDDDVDEE